MRKGRFAAFLEKKDGRKKGGPSRGVSRKKKKYCRRARNVDRDGKKNRKKKKKKEGIRAVRWQGKKGGTVKVSDRG